MFWLIMIGLLLLASLILVVPFIGTGSTTASTDRQHQNITIAREKKSLLEKQLSEGEMSQGEFDNAFLDLQTSLALDLEKTETSVFPKRGKWVTIAVLVTLPLASLSLYFQLGEYRVARNPELAQIPVRQLSEQALANMSVEEMAEIIKQRLRDNPEDAQGWFMLGRTLMAQQKFDQAVTAYQRTYDLVGEEPGVIFSLADALAMQSGGKMEGEPEALVLRALEISPQHPTGLWLAGLAAEQRDALQLAYDYWTRLLPMIQGEPQSEQEVRRLIGELEQRDASLRSEVVTGNALTLMVNLSDEIKHLADENDAVFVYAKAMNGPPMPLAVKRTSVAELPIRITLSDEDAMVENMKLSSFDEIIIGARVSKSGNPVAQEGDLFVEIGGVDRKNLPPELALSISQIK